MLLIIAGKFIHAPLLGSLEILDTVCIVDVSSGRIVALEPAFSASLDDYRKQAHIETASSDGFWIPGFVDTHTHAPQYENLGIGIDQPLLHWLSVTTFPTEESFTRTKNRQLVETKYAAMVHEYLRCGTTTACYFGAIDLASNLVLAHAIDKAGQRALVGKTCMDRNSPAPYVEESWQASVASTVDFIKRTEALKMVQPVVTPRFAISCTPTLMTELAQVANEHSVRIQSHLAENLDEIGLVAALHPESSSYTGVYDTAGLLTSKTIMAHCIHLSNDEIQLLKERRTAVAHCPTSNFALNSGVMKVRQLLRAGLRVGLGTDVSGGYSVCMLDAMRQAIIASKVTCFASPEYEALSTRDAFFLATLGGAQALNMDKDIGSFAVGKAFDALFISRRQLYGDEQLDVERQFDRFVYCGDDRQVQKVYVNGVLVHDKSEIAK